MVHRLIWLFPYLFLRILVKFLRRDAELWLMLGHWDKSWQWLNTFSLVLVLVEVIWHSEIRIFKQFPLGTYFRIGSVIKCSDGIRFLHWGLQGILTLLFIKISVSWPPENTWLSEFLFDLRERFDRFSFAFYHCLLQFWLLFGDRLRLASFFQAS